MATSTDDKGWTFDAFDPGTLREFVSLGYSRICINVESLMKICTGWRLYIGFRKNLGEGFYLKVVDRSYVVDFKL